MLIPYENRTIYIASIPIDFRLSMNGLCTIINKEFKGINAHDGSIYVFYNKDRTRVKCLFWDRNGFVLYYKKLDNQKFHIKHDKRPIANITAEELEILLSGMSPIGSKYMLENDNG